jgi:hypothetical protein
MARRWQAAGCTLDGTNSTTMTKPTSADVRPAVRDGFHEEARETLQLLRGSRQTVNVVLVALTDGVELEVWADGALRRRSRFLRDTEARKYSERLSARLTRRGYQREGDHR